MRNWLLTFGLAATPLLPAQFADALRVVETYPARGASLGGGSEDFFVRFNGPVDHITSRLFIAQSGKVVVTLAPRLNSAPNVLFARKGPLSPGDYEMSWIARSGTGEQIGGIVPFSVSAGVRP